ncbi:M20 metallopeptidase family protein [Mycoplasma sp. P36-A1]|uniref:M20 metallopeptidase family protein n=1 Tax=Mycoplasma sp. P36-A1 TaxID=3252900 RepID=UPI003C2BD3DA
MNLMYNYAQSVYNYQRNLRQYFHKYPELGGVEAVTQLKIIGELKKLGIEYEIIDHSVIAYLTHHSKEPAIALRCVMDALPIQERTNLEYKSSYNNIMHATGNDLLMASALGILKVLKEHDTQFKRNVVVIFESDSYRYSQSKRILDNDKLNKIKYIYSLFPSANTKINTVDITPDQSFIGTEFLTIKWYGYSTAAGYAHNSEDTILASSTFITQLRSMIANHMSPDKIYSITCTKSNGGFFHNMTADYSELAINVRFDSFETKKIIHEMINRLIDMVKTSFKVETSITIDNVIAPFTNNIEAGNFALQSLHRLSNKLSFEYSNPSMFATSFSEYLEHYKGAIILFGVEDHRVLNQPLYNSAFAPDDRGMTSATALFLQLVQDFK